MAQALEQREIDRKSASYKLQILSHRLVEVQETERRQIARELHDEIGQSLTVAEMHLQAAIKTNGQEKLMHRLQESIQAVDRVLEQVRDLSFEFEAFDAGRSWPGTRAAMVSKPPGGFGRHGSPFPRRHPRTPR